MNCPQCLKKTLVIASETIPNGVMRRRKCPKGHRYNTVETVYLGGEIPRKKRVRKAPEKKSPAKVATGSDLLARLTLAGKI